ncbi:MAG: phospho-sugar mutase [Candidatus Saccharimonadaceae bacterium]
MNIDLNEHLSPGAVKNVQDWLTGAKYADYKPELELMIADQRWKDLEDAFFKVIEFGTAGRRGTTGIGSNRINRVTIGESAQALCHYSQSIDPDAPTKGVVIACDTRLSSPELSQYTAQVCAANGFKTYIFDSFRSTPELSFAVRHLGCAVGIVISASHNPPADNGFKAYWNDGAQLVAPHDKGVLAVAAEIAEIHSLTDFDEAVRNGQITIIDPSVDSIYIDTVVAQAEGTARDIKIVYSPLHGAGQTNTLPVLRRAGFMQISPVEQQMVPDGNFPTVKDFKPNPEERSANDMAVQQMLAEGADIAITNDPDADRLGIMVRRGAEVVYLSGNQTVALAADYVLSKLQAKGILTPRHYLVKNIVTTEMLGSIARKYNVNCYDNILIGFKYIGEIIRLKENTDETFVLGGEESFGLLKGDYARDKDGASGALPVAEYAAELKLENKTLWDRLMELYNEHGLILEGMATMVCPGAEGFTQMQDIMTSFRSSPPEQVAGQKITAALDYQTLKRTDLATGQVSDIDCINGNVLVFEFGDRRRRVTIRPSGTEPKLKLYVQWYSETVDAASDYDAQTAFLAEISSDLERQASAIIH